MLRLIEAATTKPVTLEQLKKHCNVDWVDDDAVLGIYLDAAAEFVADRTGLVLQPAVYRLERDSWWSCLNLMVAPVREITAITYTDEAQAPQTVSDSLYSWYRTAEGAYIEFLSTFTSPNLFADSRSSVHVEISAGFDDPNATGSNDDPELVLPERVTHAILMLACSWYANREAVSQVDLKPVPMAVESLLGQLRIYR